MDANKRIYIYIYIYICVYRYIYICVCVHLYINVNIYAHIFTHKHMHIYNTYTHNTYTYIHTYKNIVCVCVCVWCACVHAWHVQVRLSTCAECARPRTILNGREYVHAYVCVRTCANVCVCMFMFVLACKACTHAYTTTSAFTHNHIHTLWYDLLAARTRRDSKIHHKPSIMRHRHDGKHHPWCQKYPRCDRLGGKGGAWCAGGGGKRIKIEGKEQRKGGGGGGGGKTNGLSILLGPGGEVGTVIKL